jgi:hypothetical protein
MALERDNQSVIALRYLWYETVTNNATQSFGPVDTHGMRSLTFGLMLEDAPDPADVINIFVYDSPDGITWTQVPDYKLLPTEGGPQHVVVIPAMGTTPPYTYCQTVGVPSCERYVRLDLFGSSVKGSPLIDVVAMMIPEDQAFRLWDPESLILDGQP